LKDLYKYKYAIFDCDGVIFQSNRIKTKAFAETLKAEPKEIVKDFILYHKINGGVSRYVKFEYYFRELKKEKNFNKMANIAITRYAKIVHEQLMNVEYVPGFLKIIDFFNKKKIPCFVVSGGDQKELHEVFKKRGIFDHFERVLGSPATKDYHISKLLLNNQIDISSIFFGDAYSDMNAALNNKIEFCFIKQFSEWKNGALMAKKYSFSAIKNFNELF
jgi:phosphoglycolate phosphatase-like HAD superfamily hydrolase|tara:strand:- start:14753 stop:15406 length:654 start_codon:yes stop_codon:yes gene_type:complete